jgi:hypothetical protein
MRRRDKVVLAASVLLLGTSVAYWVIDREESPEREGGVPLTSVDLSGGEEIPLYSGGLGTPIPGEAVSLAQARLRVDYPIPILDSSTLPDACTSVQAPVTLIQMWATSEGEDRELRQVGSSYSHGLWISVTPLAGYNFGNVSEMPTVESWFGPEDPVTELETSRVRGHVAWAGELDPNFSCEGAPVPDAIQSPSANVPRVHTEEEECAGLKCVPDAPKIMFNPMMTGSVTWLENGVAVNLVGPYSVAQLAVLAENISWV